MRGEHFEHNSKLESKKDQEREAQREVQERWDRFVRYFLEHPEIFESDYILAPGRSGLDEANYLREIFHVFSKNAPPVVLVPSDHDAPASFPTAGMASTELESRLSTPPEDWQRKLASEARAFFKTKTRQKRGRVIITDVFIAEGKAMATCGYVAGAMMNSGLTIDCAYFDVTNADPKNVISRGASEIPADLLVRRSFRLGLEQYSRHYCKSAEEYEKQVQDMILVVLPAYGVCAEMGFDAVRTSDYLDWPESAREYDPKLEGAYPSLRTPFLEKRSDGIYEVGYRYFARRRAGEVGEANEPASGIIGLREQLVKNYQTRKELVREKIRESLERIDKSNERDRRSLARQDKEE